MIREGQPDIDSRANPRVSVVIPSFNCEQYLAEAVRSALAQSYDPIEVIVVDDGSKVDQSRALQGIVDSRLRFIRQENRGVAGARNTGVHESHGELIAFLDADDRWLPRKLEVQWAVMQATQADVVFCDLHRFRRDRRLPSTYLGSLGTPPEGLFFRALVRKNVVPLSTALVTRRALDAVGGFCEDPAVWEDWDLWLRLARRYRFSYTPEVLAEYRLHDANASGDVDVLISRSLGTLNRLERESPGMFDNARRDLRFSRANLHFNLGYARLRQGRRLEARQSLRTAARLRPLHVGTWKDLIRTYIPGAHLSARPMVSDE